MFCLACYAPDTHQCIFWICLYTKPTCLSLRNDRWCLVWNGTQTLVSSVWHSTSSPLDTFLLSIIHCYFYDYFICSSHLKLICMASACRYIKLLCVSAWLQRYLVCIDKAQGPWQDVNIVQAGDDNGLWWLGMAGTGKWKLATYFFQLLLDFVLLFAVQVSCN